jgi:hypothetical protein
MQTIISMLTAPLNSISSQSSPDSPSPHTIAGRREFPLVRPLFPRTARPRTAGLQVHVPKDDRLPIHSKRLQSTKAAKSHLRSLRVLKLAFADPCPGWDTLLDPTISSLGTSLRCPFSTADVCASFTRTDGNLALPACSQGPRAPRQKAIKGNRGPSVQAHQLP